MNKLLARSLTFEEALSGILGADGVERFDDAPKHLACAGACLLSIEHAASVRRLFATQAPHSGTALLRVQYEALLRGAWILYVANELQVTKLTVPLDSDSEQSAKNLPGPVDILRALVCDAPVGLTQPLQEFEAISIKALNSFVHGGIHPLRRIAEGFPQALGLQIVRNSNGLMHMGFRLLASLSDSQDCMNQITRTYRNFQDCLPMMSAKQSVQT